MSASILLFSAMLQAGAGHDHGNEAAAPIQSTTPRLAMESNQFELVIVQELHGLQLYLDDFSSNTPLTAASIELEIDGQAINVENTKQGTYHAHVETPLNDGLRTIMVSIIDGNMSDLLIGEWDIHHEDADEMTDLPTETTTLQKLLPIWLGIGSGMGIVLLGAFWRDSKNKREGTR